jgi:NTE family protein
MMQGAGSESGTVGLILAGGGARGAYEMGALSALLPALPAGDQPRILVGTSVGALNCAYLAATADRKLDERLRKATAFWERLRWKQVLEPLTSWDEIERVLAYLREVLTGRGRVESLLDPTPLRRTLTDEFQFHWIDHNIHAGHLDRVAAVCTSAATNLSVVFHSGETSPAPDAARGVEYVAAKLTAEHILGSAAVPGIFPPVEVTAGRGQGWYFDGGTRLNTPIKPARALGAKRIIVVALNSLRPRVAPPQAKRPDALEGAAQIIQGLLVDPLVNDVYTMARNNELTLDGHLSPQERDVVPYMLIAPEHPDEIGQIAADLYNERYSSLFDVLRSDVARIGRLVDAGASAVHGELFSYLCFADEFAKRLIELGRRDARAWLSAKHDDGVWQERALRA